MRSYFLVRAAALIFAAFALASPKAGAHAVIVESSPAAGAEIPSGDADIMLRYNSRIDHLRSRLTLVSQDGVSRPLPILPDSAPDVIAAKASGLTPGQYRLRWQVLAVDGHLTRGDIPFRVDHP
jgi:methionine-rich copper-binding protein CopC